MVVQIDTTSFYTVNGYHPTRIAAYFKSSPDRSIASRRLLLYITWHPKVALNSDHIAIIFEVVGYANFITSERRTFIN